MNTATTQNAPAITGKAVGAHIRIPLEVYESPAFDGISLHLRLLYIDFLRDYDFQKNVKRCEHATYSYSACRLDISDRFFYEGMKELRAIGFIEATKDTELTKGKRTRYTLSDRWKKRKSNGRIETRKDRKSDRLKSKNRGSIKRANSLPRVASHSLPEVAGSDANPLPEVASHSLPEVASTDPNSLPGVASTPYSGSPLKTAIQLSTTSTTNCGKNGGGGGGSNGRNGALMIDERDLKNLAVSVSEGMDPRGER